MTARAFVFGDDIDTDQLAPGHAMKLAPEAMARFCLEAIDPTFASRVRPGDVVVAGVNFGMGSAREQAAMVLVALGVGVVLARSFARIFYRNAINVGLPAFVLPGEILITDGDALSIDVETAALYNLTMATDHPLTPLPPHLIAMIRDGGLIPHLKRRFAQRRAEA
jgi:3-isopropylmalate/(R)-2-methylmalate dehydratase small subunit